MFEKNMKIAYLFDLYGDALDEHIGSVLRSYYNDDLSLAEIASEVGISRQGVRHLIKKGEEQLRAFEDKLGLIERHKALLYASELLSKVKEIVSRSDAADGESISELIDSATDIILNKNV